MAEQFKQIGKIVANALIKNQAIYLPSLGSLRVETLPSKLSSSRSEITSPKYIVKYSAQQNGRSIIELIESALGVDSQRSEAIYQEWLESVAVPSGANIEGVGAIVNKRFNIAATLDSALNPEDQKIIQLKRRRGGWMWIAASVLMCVVVGVAANYSMQWYLSSLKAEDVVSRVEVQPIETQEPTELTESAESAESSEPQDLEESTLEQPDSTQQMECVAAPEVVENPRYRVVYGVFSTPENAQKGAELAHQEDPQIIANVTPLGDKFMVSIFYSDEIAAAKAFIEGHKATYPDLWIYKRRGE